MPCLQLLRELEFRKCLNVPIKLNEEPMKRIESYRAITVFLLGFIGKTAIIYFLFFASRPETIIENIGRSFMFSLLISIVAWPIMWLIEYRNEKRN